MYEDAEEVAKAKRCNYTCFLSAALLLNHDFVLSHFSYTVRRVCNPGHSLTPII